MRIFKLAFMLILLCWLPARPTHAQQYKGCTEIDQVPEDECVALEKLFENTDGLKWFNNSGWKRANQPCSWFGVTCNSKEWPLNVVKIELVDNNVSGSLPGELGNLPELQELIIVNTSLRGGSQKLGSILPSSLSFAHSLRVINLSQNAIRGAIPAEYGRLKQLEVLNIQDNLLDGFLPDSLSRATSLKTINLSKNNLRGIIPESWGGLDSLETIDLSTNLLNGNIPKSFENLKRLKDLRLSENNLSGTIPRELATLDSLSVLILSDNEFKGPLLPDIANLSEELSFCAFENNDQSFCVPNSNAFQHFREDGVCGVPLSDNCSICNSNSTTLDSACRGLESLYFDTAGYNWTNNDAWLVHTSPCEWFGIQCEGQVITSLSLPDNNLVGNLPEALGGLTGLNALDLSNNQLAGPLPFSVAALAANTSSCSLQNNTESLCVPDREAFAALGINPICELSLSASCREAPKGGISSISSRFESNSLVLEWTAPAGVAQANYSIEKKIDDVFETVIEDAAEIESDPNTQTLSYPLGELSTGIYIFRIKQTLADGSQSFSAQLEVQIGLKQGFLFGEIYPNPFSTTARFEIFSETDQQVRVNMYNALGQRIKVLFDGRLQANQHQAIKLDSENLAGGLYFIHIHGPAISATKTVTLQP